MSLTDGSLGEELVEVCARPLGESGTLGAGTTDLLQDWGAGSWADKGMLKLRLKELGEAGTEQVEDARFLRLLAVRRSPRDLAERLDDAKLFGVRGGELSGFAMTFVDLDGEGVGHRRTG